MVCQENLKVWNRNTFGHVQTALKRKLEELKEAEEGDCYRTNPGRIQMLRKEIGSLQSREVVCGSKELETLGLKKVIVILPIFIVELINGIRGI